MGANREPTLRTDPWATPTPPPRRSRLPHGWSLLVPPVALGALAAWRGGRAIWIIGAAIAIVAVLVLLWRAPARAAAMAMSLRTGLRAVGEAVARVLVFLVALPALYLPGAVVRAWRAARGRGSTGWVLRAEDAVQERRLATRPFGPPGAGVWRRQLVGSVLVIAALGAVAVAVDRRGAPATTPTVERVDPLDDQAAVRFSDLPAYAGVPFADALKEEQDQLASSLVEDPVTGLAVPDFTGRYTNVRDGVRETLSPTCSCPAATLWLVGGSSAFGLGQRDQHTIASELVRLAAADGIALEVTNLAVPGWTGDQEVKAVEQRLAAEDDGPDLVVSYTGYNDVVAALLSSVVEGRFPDGPLVFDAAVVDAYVAGDASAADLPGGPEALTAQTVARLDELAERLDVVVASAGGRAHSFFQPDALASDEQFAPVRDVYRGLPVTVVPDLRRQLLDVSRGVRSLVDLRTIYDDEPSSVFADWVHTNETGAAVAAREIYERISPDLAAAAG